MCPKAKLVNIRPEIEKSGFRKTRPRLCMRRHSLYAFVRRTGCSPHDAEDVTQGFFTELLYVPQRTHRIPLDRRGTLRRFFSGPAMRERDIAGLKVSQSRTESSISNAAPSSFGERPSKAVGLVWRTRSDPTKFSCGGSKTHRLNDPSML